MDEVLAAAASAAPAVGTWELNIQQSSMLSQMKDDGNMASASEDIKK